MKRSIIDIDASRGYRAYLYEPRGSAARGAYLVAQGLHFEGPDDVRLDRFCRVLAASGILVLAPFLPDFCSLIVRKTAPDDLTLAFERMESEARARGLQKPGIFSISFGSWPAIEVAAREQVRDRVGALVLFGGFAEFGATIRFAISGRLGDGSQVRADRDPLNSPVVFLNLLPWIDVPGEKAALDRALRKVVERTWGREEMKRPGARDPIAHEIASSLCPEQAELFLKACGLLPGAEHCVDSALMKAGDAFDFIEPLPRFRALKAPVFIVHGRDDDVIPWTEAEALRQALPQGHPHELHLMGMVGHSAVRLPRPRELYEEARALLRVARVICDASAMQSGR